MNVFISQPAKSSMQSGHHKSNKWMLTFEPENKRKIEPLMGWTSSADTRQQLVLWFNSKEEAIDYARKQGYFYRLLKLNKRTIKPKSYAENFSCNRLIPWTH